MPRAILKDGVLYPLEPLPPEWKEGQELIVDLAPAHDMSPEEVDRWAEEMDAVCAEIDPEDEARLQAAIDEHRRWAKEWMRGYMGLPDVIRVDVPPTE
jgi:hypothetical protein